MRAAVLGAAALLVAAIGGVGGLVWTSFSRSSGKTRAVARAEDGAANKAARPENPGAHPARPIGRAWMPELPGTSDDPDGPRGPEAPSDPGNPRRSGSRAGIPDLGDPGQGVDPGPPAGPGAASPRAASRGGFPPAPVAKGSTCPAWMADMGTFCIDTTEVTNVLYSAFLAAKPSAALQPKACAWNVDYTPSGGPPASDTRPVVGVDWCDAWLYCAWSGKRLCGHMDDGGNDPPASFADASSSEWFDVCTNGGTSAFSYGDAFDSAKCAHAAEDGSYVHANSIPTCVGTTKPYDAVFDMSGNAGEWEGSCSGESGAADLCRVRGGGPQGSCAMDDLERRDQASKTVGFRCCADEAPK